MKILLFLCFSVCALSKVSPLIEGGKNISITDMKYIDFIKLEKYQGPECSATRVAHNKILTAAHCVIDQNSNEIYRVGGSIGMYGTITKIAIHPKYSEYFRKMINIKALYDSETNKDKKAQLKTKYRNFEKLKSSHDIAVVTTNREKSKRDIPYPKVISKETKFSKRNNIEIVGFGNTKLSWDGNQSSFVFSSPSKQAKLAKNNWITCPYSYEKSEAQKLGEDMLGILQIENRVLHKIQSNKETQDYSKSMVLQGDSGAGVIEYDQNNEMVITAIAATVTPYAKGSGQPTMKIEYPSGKSEIITLDKMPSDWGDSNKADTDFSEIKNQIIKDGENPNDPQIKITRSYTRVSTGQFADLLHPSNQSFLKENL